MSPQFNNGAYYGYEVQQPSFAPGQVFPMGQQLAVNTNTPPSTGNPFATPINETPMTPNSAPMDGPYEQAALMRKSSQTLNHPYVTRGPNGSGELAPPEAEYVDLSRSSVTPFQAAQYAEISRRLNTSPPLPMATPVLATVAEAMASEQPPVPKTSNTPPLDVGQNVAVGNLAARLPDEHTLPESPFADPHNTRTSAVDPDEGMPQPPSPTYSSASRVNSNPPILPEIHVPQRAFSPMGYDGANVTASPRVGPSPLANTVSVPQGAHLSVHHAQYADVPTTPTVESGAHSPVTPRANAPQVVRPDTMYSDDDAYAGI